MANNDWPRGFHPLKTKDGGHAEIIYYPLKASYSTAIGAGNIVSINATSGYIMPGDNTRPTQVIGVAAEYYAGSATSKTRMGVYAGHNQIFIGQGDSALTNEASYLGKNFQVVGNTGMDTNSGYGSGEIDASSGDTTTATNLIMRCIGKSGEIGNEWANTNCDLLLEFIPTKLYKNQAVAT